MHSKIDGEKHKEEPPPPPLLLAPPRSSARFHLDSHANGPCRNSLLQPASQQPSASSFAGDNSSNNAPAAASSYYSTFPSSAPELEVSVSDPVKHGEGVSAYVSYKVQARPSGAATTAEAEAAATPASRALAAAPGAAVIRRFRDFQWLRGRLSSTLRGAVVPPLPETSILQKYALSADFVEGRRQALARFANAVAAHPELRRSEDFAGFLTEAEDDWALRVARVAAADAEAASRAQALGLGGLGAAAAEGVGGAAGGDGGDGGGGGGSSGEGGGYVSHAPGSSASHHPTASPSAASAKRRVVAALASLRGLGQAAAAYAQGRPVDEVWALAAAAGGVGGLVGGGLSGGIGGDSLGGAGAGMSSSAAVAAGEDPEFLRSREYLAALESHLAEVAKQASRLVKKQAAAGAALAEFGAAAAALARLEGAGGAAGTAGRGRGIPASAALSDALVALGHHTQSLSRQAQLDAERLSRELETPLKDAARSARSAREAAADRLNALAALSAARAAVDGRRARLTRLRGTPGTPAAKLQGAEGDVLASQAAAEALRRRYAGVVERTGRELPRWRAEGAGEMGRTLAAWATAQSESAQGAARVWRAMAPAAAAAVAAAERR